MTNADDPKQLLLELPINETFALEDFMVAASNEEAVKWIDAWPNWGQDNNPFHCLIIYGPAGCGKTHLCHVWQKIANAQILKMDQLSPTMINDQNFVFIIEDVDLHICDDTVLEGLLHLYNWTKEQGGYLLLTAKDHPKNWKIDLADLSSRLLASHSVKIKSPDDNLLQAIIIKQFSDRQITLPTEVLNYLMPRLERSFDAITKMVHDVDQLSWAEKKKITIPTVKQVLDHNQ